MVKKWSIGLVSLFLSFFILFDRKRIADCTGCSSCWHLSLHPSAFNNVLYVVVGCRSLLSSNTWNKKERERTQGVNGSWQSAWDATQLRAWDGPSWMRTSSGKTKDQNLFHPPKKTHGWKSINQPILILIYVMYWLVPDYQRLCSWSIRKNSVAPFYFRRAPRWENKEPIEWIAAASISPHPTPYGKAKEAETTKRNFSIRRPFPLNIITYGKEKEWKSYSREREELEAY
jgi:hypothetical protein